MLCQCVENGLGGVGLLKLNGLGVAEGWLCLTADDPRRRIGVMKQPIVRPKARARVEHNPNGRRSVDTARGQLWVVGSNRASADNHRIRDRAQPV